MFYSVSTNAAAHKSARPRRDQPNPTVTSGATELLDSRTAPPSKAGHGAGATWDLPSGFDPQPEVKAPEANSGFHKLASGAALALSVLGVGVGMVGAAAPAYAATSQSLTATRSQSPVTFSDTNDVVSKFDGVHQLYVKGNSLSAAEMAKLQKILKDYPNIYVVLMDYTADVQSADYTVSRGIGNSQAFQDVRNEVTGEKEAAVFMVYFDSNQGRKIFMRSEELPDKAGVGDPDFAVNGQPAKLLRTFLRARDAGKDFPGMLEDVFKEVDSGVNNYVNNLVNGARDGISSAQTQLTSARQKVAEFQKEHGKNQSVGHPDLEAWSGRLERARAALAAKDFAGARSLAQSLQRDIQNELSAIGSFEQSLSSAQQVVDQAERKLEEGKDAVKAFQRSEGKGGSLGSPDVAGWEGQLKQAREALSRGSFADARSLANNLVTTISIYRQNVAEFQAAQTTATAVEADLAKLQAELDTLPDNSKGQQARQLYAQAKEHFADYQRLHDGKENGYASPLAVARQEVAEGLEQASASRAEAEATKKAIIIGSTAVTVGIVALGVFANYRARQKRKEANQALENATADISARTQALVALMDEADYQSIARYSGKTEKMAKDLIENVTDALTLVGGAEKFLSEAEALIQPKSLKNLFLTGNYEKGIALLTDPETRLDFNFEDSSRAVMDKGSKAESWRDELLRKGASREFKKSLYEVLLAMAEKRDTARGLLDEITSKNAEITKFLDSVEAAARAAEEHSRALQESGQKDQLFTAPSVTENLLPMVSGPAQEGGLIARGRDIKESDPVRAWDEFATPARRMTGEAEGVVDLGNYSRGTLLPTLVQADAALHPHQVDTKWAHQATGKLSDRLDDTADTALRVSIQQPLATIRQEVDSLVGQVKTVVRQDRERREVAPGLISGAEDDVSTARSQIDEKLKAMGHFAKGNPQEVLREPGLDPTDRTQKAHQHLDSIKPLLDRGDTATAQRHLDGVRSQSAEAHQIVADTRSALSAYPATLNERQTRTQSIDDSVESVYAPSLDRIKQTYVPEVLQLIAGEVNSGETITDDIPNADKLLARARKETQVAVGHFDQAYLLTARDDLNVVDGTLKVAQNELDSVTGAEQLLGQKQQAVESELRSLDSRLGQTRQHAGEHYVRRRAKELLGQAERAVGSARVEVEQTPRNPFAAKTSLASAEGSRQACESAIAADHQAYTSADSRIDSAASEISSAESTISWALRQNWSYSSSQGSAHESVDRSDLSSAYSALSSAESALSSARGQMNGQGYEEAESEASRAISHAKNADSEARSAVNRAESRFEAEKARIKHLEYLEEQRRLEEERRRREQQEAEERRRREEQEAEDRRRREEEQRRRDEENRNSGGGSGSSGGGWSGGGGSGSSGGSW